MLLNESEEYQKDLVTGSQQHGHKFEYRNSFIYDCVNYLNNMKFSVNKELLNYLNSEGGYILDYYKLHKIKHYLNNLITLDIARTYKDEIFYLNVNLDWRGRIYTQSFYLDYQGNEFSLALLTLCGGERLTMVGMKNFYIYGANCYNEDNIQKKVFDERVKWVNRNLENIYSMKPEFILKAESPTLFAVFCLNMKKLRDNPQHPINIPVFLDATCSGIQHFAGMILDYDLAKEVNLLKSETGDVKDFYKHSAPIINKAINTS